MPEPTIVAQLDPTATSSETFTKWSVLPFREIVVEDTSLPAQTEVTVVEGEPGLAAVRYRVDYCGYVEVARQFVDEQIVREPVDRIVRRAPGPEGPSRGLPFGARPMVMTATAYTPYGPDTNGVTATGVTAKRGIVAVDPQVIPLGSRVYVEGYGYALASDTLADLRAAGLVPRKCLGQHFLTDDNIAGIIVGSVLEGEPERVLEIGPGLGLLTARVAPHVRRLVAIEKDPLLASVARENLKGITQAEVVEADFLKADLGALLRGAKWTVMGNLPYSITSPILFRLTEERRRFDRMVLMVQREVAGRMLARPGSKEFGLLGILVEMHYEARLLKTVSANCFYPPPKVQSAIVELKVRRQCAVRVDDEQGFFAFCKRLFAHRRKQMVTILKGLLPGKTREAAARYLEAAGIAPTARPEQLSIGTMAALYRTLSAESLR